MSFATSSGEKAGFRFPSINVRTKLALLLMATGILPGPTRPYQVVASKPGKPDSAMVGTLG